MAHKSAANSKVRKALLTRIAAAEQCLAATRLSTTRVHSARKQIKRARAILRILREGLSKAAYRRENLRLRDCGRSLSQRRDAAVVAKALRQILQGHAGLRRSAAVVSLQRGLRAEQRRLDLNKHAGQSVKLVRAQLALTRGRVEAYKLARDDRECLERGLQRIYHKARRTWRTALARPSAENLHELRKQTKYLWHSLQLVERLRYGKAGRLVDRAHRLSNLLGDEHDLAVLKQRVSARSVSARSAAHLQELHELVDAGRRERQSIALPLAEKLYGDPPGKFVDKIIG